MNEERKMILQMVQEGSISVEEAERLLEAIPAGGESRAVTPYEGVFQPKRILVQVTEGEKTRINVKIPFTLVRAGLKLGQTFGALGAKHMTDSDEAAMMHALSSIDIDEVLSSLNDGSITLPYVMVDMEEEDKQQRIYVVLE